MRRLRESFAAKLFVGLLGTVGALLLVTYLVVRAETGRQVQAAAERAVQNASTQFALVEETRRQEATRVARPLTEGRRTLAELDAAIEADDPSFLVGLAAYELDLAGLDYVLVSFTDPRGRPVLTLLGSETMPGSDPAGMGVVAQQLLESNAREARSYRVLDGVLFSVRTAVIEEGGRAIGTLSLGLPIPDDEVSRIGALVGVEVCVVVGDECVTGTPTAREQLSARLVASAGLTAPEEVEASGERWSIQGRPLMEADPTQGSWVIAVPLNPVVAPFTRITQALLVGGGLALLLAILVGVALSRGLTRPVRALVAATGRVAEGDYEIEVPVTTQDELGTLAAAFNDMTRGLLLKERLRSILDVVSSREVAEELVRGGLELGGENRQVTVLFGDIRGFSTLTEGMEPQGVINLLNECMQRLSDAVVAQGGHVDKFVGDEIMAVFNAPKALDDHAGRAIRAAVGMQDAMGALNRDRAARGEVHIGLGVGVNTGVVVAGKMGSETRNNYTVLGDAVNLGARLCSAAQAGEVLITRDCLTEAKAEVNAKPLGGRAFKGFSGEIEVFSVAGIADGPDDRAGSSRSAHVVVGLLLAASALISAPASAQLVPTLRDLGAEYVSNGGAVQVGLSGQLDLEAFAFPDGEFGLAGGVEGRTLLAPRLRLFTDIFLGEAVYGLVELRADRGAAPREGVWEGRVEQAFLRVSTASGAVSLQLGRFASPFGSYALRHLTDQDPFVVPPLFYDYRTMMCAGIAPPSTASFLSWQDRPEVFRAIGAPPVWGVPYQWGAMVAGARGRVTYRLAAMNSAPSSDPLVWGWDTDHLKHPSWVAGVGVRLSPAWSAGASFNRGPWLEELKRGSLPATRPGSGANGPAATIWDFNQTLVALDVTYAAGPVVARAEVVRDQWQVPNMSQEPVEFGGSFEVQADLRAGLFAAARVGVLDFRPVEDGGAYRDWDHDARRIEASVGYRLDRNAGFIATVGTTPRRSDLEGSQSVIGGRLWVTF